jgi:hypothetical protein
VRQLRATVAAVALVLASCSGTTDPLESATVAVTSQPGALELTNLSSARTFYFIYERGAAARIIWAPCVDVARCPSLAPGEQVVIPNTTIGGYEPGKHEAIVWSWHGPPLPGPDDIRAVVVALQPL